MAAAGNNDATVVIIKKVKKVSAASHHGGAWKVAYADFVTAMMAFFLLLWLLSATTEEQKEGIAEYFSPVTARSEEHTSELQSLMRISYAVFCLKKKKTNKRQRVTRINSKSSKSIKYKK